MTAASDLCPDHVVERRVTGAVLVLGTSAFLVAASVLQATFDWPDVLREPASVVLPRVVAGGDRLTWTWAAVTWSYALLAVPVLLLPAALGRVGDPVLRALTAIGGASVLLSVVGFGRWVLVVPPLARAYDEGDAVTRAALAAAWTAQHQYGGALLGEHLGQLTAVVWSGGVALVLLRTRVLPRAIGVLGLLASLLYLLNQGEVLAAGFPDLPRWDAAGLVGSSAWALWLVVTGAALLRVRRPGPSRS